MVSVGRSMAGNVWVTADQAAFKVELPKLRHEVGVAGSASAGDDEPLTAVLEAPL
jgi:hypothetical protein